MDPRGLTKALRCRLGAKLGVMLLGGRGDPDVRPRCEYTDPRARLGPRAPGSMGFARLPQEVIHVRVPITDREADLLPAWFNQAEPVDFAGDGVPIRFP